MGLIETKNYGEVETQDWELKKYKKYEILKKIFH